MHLENQYGFGQGINKESDMKPTKPMGRLLAILKILKYGPSYVVQLVFKAYSEEIAILLLQKPKIFHIN